MRLVGYEQRDLADRHRFDGEIVTAAGEPVPLWFEIAPKVDGLVLDRADSFVLVALILAMQHGEDLAIEPPVSDLLAMSLDDLVAIYVPQDPRNHLISVVAPSRSAGPGREGRGTVVALSGGLDSFFALLTHKIACPPQNPPITHAFYSDMVLAPGEGARERFRLLADARRGIVGALDIPLHVVSSNMSELLGPWPRSNYTARNAATAHLFAPVCSLALQGAGHIYRKVIIGKPHTSPPETIVVPRFSSELLHQRLIGGTHRRIHKLAELVDVPLFQRELRVCWREPERIGFSIPNCGACPKCLRTLLGIEIVGRREDFAESFDLDAYRTKRDAFVLECAYHPTDWFAAELLPAARERGVDLGLGRLKRRYWSRPSSYARLLPTGVKAPIKRALGMEPRTPGTTAIAVACFGLDAASRCAF